MTVILNKKRMKVSKLNIPVKPHVKSYFEHKLILGPGCNINKRHMVGELLSMVLSFGVTRKEQLPVEYRLGNAELGSLTLRVEFPVDAALMTPHHLYAIGYTLERWWESALFNFVVGYFDQSPGLPWAAAVRAFFEKYDIDTSVNDVDYTRRYMHLKYNTTLRQLYKNEEAEHMAALNVAP